MVQGLPEEMVQSIEMVHYSCWSVSSSLGLYINLCQRRSSMHSAFLQPVVSFFNSLAQYRPSLFFLAILKPPKTLTIPWRIYTTALHPLYFYLVKLTLSGTPLPATLSAIPSFSQAHDEAFEVNDDRHVASPPEHARRSLLAFRLSVL